MSPFIPRPGFVSFHVIPVAFLHQWAQLTDVLISTDSFLQSKTKCHWGWPLEKPSCGWDGVSSHTVVDDRYLICFNYRFPLVWVHLSVYPAEGPGLVSRWIRAHLWVLRGRISVHSTATDSVLVLPLLFQSNIFTLKILLCAHIEVRIQLGKRVSPSTSWLLGI